jgi:hypothetical protein
MKKTLIAILAVAVLAGLFFALTMKKEGEEMKVLAIPGIKVDDKAEPDEEMDQEAREAEAAKVGPADKITYSWQGTEITIEKRDKDAWRITKPVDALAETYKVRSMLRAFDTALKSNYSRKVSEEALAQVGLDPENRIRATLYQGTNVLVDLHVGRVDKKGEMGQEPDSMVMPTDGELVYYRLPGKDLRTAFEIELSELRDKKLFDLEKDAITKLIIEDPRDTAHKRIVLEKKKSAAPPPDEKEKKDGEPKPAEEKAEWEMIEPAGIKLENPDSYASTFANARADEFMDKLPGADASALDKAYRITAVAKVKDKEQSYTLSLGAGRKKGVYAKVEGAAGYVLIPKYSAEQLMKSLSGFREKKAFSFEANDIETIQVVSAGSPTISLKKSGNDWTFVEPAGLPASTTKVKSMASGIASLRIAEYLEAPPAAAETGLEQPELKLTVTLSASAGGGTSTLLVGKSFKNKEDQERYYAKVDGAAEIFTIMKYNRENIAKGIDDLKDKRVFLVEKDEIQEVTITHPDETLKFAKVDKDGKQVWNLTAPKAKDDVALISTVTTLASLDAEKIVEGKTMEEVGLTREAITVSFKLKNGTEHSLTFSEEVDDNRNFAMTSSVESLKDKIFLISKFKTQNLTKKLADFEK